MRTALTCLIFLPFLLLAQDYHIKKATSTIRIDGVLDEEDWSIAQVADDFHQYFPNDTSLAESGVAIRFTYDDQNLYFIAVMQNLNEDRAYAVPSLRRDYRGNFDGITLEIDAFQDNTNAFQFGINPYGVQREGLISNGGNRGDDLSLSWDNRWVADAQMYDGYWIAEAAIPFKTIRYPAGSKNWNINVYRIDTEKGERSTWGQIPRNFIILSLAFMKDLEWDQPLKKPGPNLSLIPYVSSGGARDFESETDKSTSFNSSVGGDAKIGIGPSLNLDLTVNPDFSQVEADQQVTDLNRFELFFPERRQFFLENADLFESFGHPFLSRPFFSRRIGIARDESTGTVVQNRIYGGARLSGKLDNNWRIGLLNMQAAEDEDINLPSINYAVGAIQRKIFGRSNIGVIMVNKQSGASYDETDTTASYFGPNRLVGIDYNIASSNSKWNGKINYHQSFDELTKADKGSHTAWISYQSRKWIWSYAQVYVGKNHNPEVGFVPRQGIFRINPDFGYNFFPKRGTFNSIELKGEVEFFWNGERKTDHTYAINLNSGLSNTGRFSASILQQYTYLFDSFDPTQTDGTELQEGDDFIYHGLRFNYRGDGRQVFNYSINGYFGEYFNGERINIGTEFNYRFQPILALRLIANYNRIRMPEPYNDANLWLIGPRIDLTLSKSVFLTNFVQFNTQIDNVNINARFQWRFAPVSDLFIVYTDNYGTENMQDVGLQAKNRALIIKLSYWLNL